MGIHAYVYRSDLGDCTNGGISSKAKGLTIVNANGPFEPDDNHPAAMLVSHVNHAVIRPAEKDSEGVYHPVNKWWMFGGNYAATSDSRFGEAVERLLGRKFYGAVPIHDRCED